MTHPLHDYMVIQLAEKLKTRRVVVWYDSRREFGSFVSELLDRSSSGQDTAAVRPARVASLKAHLVQYDGSFLEVRARVEPLVSADVSELVVIYVPGVEHDRKTSMLLELEQAGECWKPQLKRLARNVLRQKYTDGAIDELLAPDRVRYEDLVRALAAAGEGEAPSILKAIYHRHPNSESLLADWLADDSQDSEIAAKEARAELDKLLQSRLGLTPPAGASLAKLRAVALRYVLANEFRADLGCPAPAALDSIPRPPSTDQTQFVRKVASSLRSAYPESYVRIADQVQGELNLASQPIEPAHLGSIDTFRFEERALLKYCGELLARGEFALALDVVSQREGCFWILREFVSRKAQWEACRRMAELGLAVRRVAAELATPPASVDRWVGAYSAPEGWHLVDRAQRKLESWVAGLDDEPDERALGIVRRAYDDLCSRMASQFTVTLSKADWVVSGVLHQTRVHAEVLSIRPSPVAYFMVDALRFEMGADVADRLPQAAELSLRPAFAAIPGITPVGMAALLPGASSDFSVVEQQGKLGARIDDAFLPDLVSRRKFFASRAAGMLDISLDELLSLQPSKLAKKLGSAPVVVVRSQEIDHAGETGFTFQARQIMDTVIDNLARAIRKLAAAGIEHFVVSADHGHLFFATDRDESLRTAAPSSNAPLLHRRCWGGHGGATPSGCTRVPATKLGYNSELDFVFPPGVGVFKTGGDLMYYHGGISPQELIVPVITVRLKARESARPKQGPITVSNLPDAITNRIFSVVLELGGATLSLLEGSMVVRPVLLASGRQVGAAGMAVGAEFDAATSCVKLHQTKPATVALRLTEEVSALRLVVLDPATDAELYRSPADIPVRLAM